MKRLLVAAGLGLALVGCGGGSKVASLSKSTVTAEPGALPADGIAVAIIRVTAKDDRERPIEGREVRLEVSGSGNALSPQTAQTDEAGLATFTLSSVMSGLKTITASVDGVTLEQRAEVTFTSVDTDTTPPAKVEDLAVSSATALTLTLSWTAVGDDGTVGTAAAHELRWATTEVTLANFAQATALPLGEPGASGTAETATLTGLSSSTLYYFGLRVRDAAGNASFATTSGSTLACPAGYAGAACEACAEGFRETSAGVCEDHCTNPDPCNPPPQNICDGDLAVRYPVTAGCTPTTSGQFYVCEGPVTEDCAAIGQVCFEAACTLPRSPAAAELLITEVMSNPLAPPQGQWFEVHNLSGDVLDLAGVTVQLVGGENFGVPAGAGLRLPPLGYAVFGYTADAGENGGAKVDFGWGAVNAAFALEGSHTLRLLLGSVVLEALAYGAIAPATPAGTSASLSSRVLGAGANQASWYWCAATAPFGGGSLGTPGSANGDCGISVSPPVDFCRLQFPHDAGRVEAAEVVETFLRVYEPQVTDRNQAGNDYYPFLLAELGHGSAPSAGQPDPEADWSWTPATFNPSYGPSSPGFAPNDDELSATLSLTAPGSHLFGYRVRMRESANGALSSAVYCDRNGVASVPSAGVWGTVEVLNPQADLSAARAAADGTGLLLPIRGAYVTAVKPFFSTTSDPAGFFVQGSQSGPALFIQVDASTLNPLPTVSDRVSFDITGLATTSGGIRQATGIANWQVLSTGHPVFALAKDLSNETDVVSNLASYEHELVTLSATIASNFAGAGTSFVSAQIQTAALPPETNFRLRLHEGVRDSLDLTLGCKLSVVDGVPMWRNNAQAQPLVWDASKVVVNSCPAPRFLDAVAPFGDEVLLTFDRVLDAASVLPDGSQFTILPSLAVHSAQLVGTKQVKLTTGIQVGNQFYTVTEAGTVTDLYGKAVPAVWREADFIGYDAVCRTPQVVISQVYGGGGNVGSTYTHDFIELHNRGITPVDLAGWSVQYISVTGTGNWAKTDLSGSTILAPGQFFLVQQAVGTGGTTALPAPDSAGTIALAGTAGKVALVSHTTALTGTCPTGMVDLVGYGTTANCYSGSGPTPAPSAVNAVIRQNNGCQDDNDNASNFVAAPPNPRNSAVAPQACYCL